MNKMHVIWGQVDLSDSTDASNSFSSKDQRQQPHGVEEHRVRPLPKDVQRYLGSVVFEDSSDSLSKQNLRGDDSDGVEDDDGHPFPSAVASGAFRDGETGASGEAVMSAGSPAHFDGKCRPCHYVNSKLGCINGSGCDFCHLEHPKKNRPRPCKSKRLQCKRIVTMLEEMTNEEPQQFEEAAKVLASQSTYLRKILRNRSKASDGTEKDSEHAEQQTSHQVVQPAAPATSSSASGGAIAPPPKSFSSKVSL